jgi:flagellar motor switch protein FliN/FliY
MNQAIIWLAEQWAARLGPAVSAMTGERCSARVAPGLPLAADGGAAISGLFSFDIAPDARLCVLIGESVWTAVGKAVLAAAGIEQARQDELEGTFLEVLQQSLAPLAQALSPVAGREVAAGPWERTAKPQPLSEWAGLVVELNGEAIGELWLSASAELQAALKLTTEQRRNESARSESGSAPGPVIGRGSKTLDLLLEVELPVGVSFGRTQMRLKDAIKLSTGSIVELNRTITEPVEIIVNNCVIARGEVVVVEGNYGVRIREIISREERLRTLF